MPVSWTTKKQFFYFVVFSLVVAGILAFFWAKVAAPTCFDNKQNQDEGGIDCGGPCQKQCVGEVKEMIVLWSRVVEIGRGEYEAVALVKNPNLFLAVPSARYQFKIYDENNLLVASREGETFINPGEVFAIFETGIDVGERVPKRAFLGFEQKLDWEILQKEKEQIVVSGKEFINAPFPRLSAEVQNKAISSVRDIHAVAVLYDENGNAQAVSSTVIDSVQGGDSEKIIFTWPKSFAEEPASSEIFLRTNLTQR